MSISAIENNEVAKRIIMNAIENGKLAYTLILKGNLSDSSFTALQIAKALNCKNPTPDSCDNCETCVKIEKNVHPDVTTVEPEGSFIKIDQIRRLMDIASIRPMIGKKRIFIIKRAENMNEEASNAFLKTLEEPSAHSHFFLLTENPEKILPTIRSRCLRIEILTSSESAVEKIVKRGFDRSTAIFLSRLFENDYEKAISSDVEMILQRRENVFKIIEKIKNGEYFQALEFLRSELEKPKEYSRAEWNEDVDIFLRILLNFIRDLIKINLDETSSLANPDLLDKMMKLKERLEVERLVNLVEKTDFLRKTLEKNVYAYLFPFILFIELKDGLK